MVGRRAGTARRWPGAAFGLLVVLVLASTAAPNLAESPAAPGASVAHAAAQSSTAPPRAHPPGLKYGSPRDRSLARPSASSEFYTQEGATVSQLNGSGATGVARLSEYVKLVNSPYSTAYELNGLSSTGDWWQIVIGDNWPGCNSGFEEATEVWDNVQNSGPITCDSNVTLAAGDLVEFTIYFSSGNGCMLLRDVTTSTSHTICEAQPDSGATKWSFLSTSSNAYGYYTGPMTEVINLTASSCPDNTYMPRVAYMMANGTHITQYVAWSDEFDLASGTNCYSTAENVQTIGVGDPTSYLVDTASGTGYGPHWEDGQNYTMVAKTYGWRFETDPKPLTSVTLAGSPTTAQAGSPVNFTAAVSGGVLPYSVLWSLNGVFQSPASVAWTWTAGLAGKYNVVAYGVDNDLEVVGPSNTVVIDVPGPLQVTSVNANPTAGTDVGLPVEFSVGISGGRDYWAIVWSGLPAGCAGANSSFVNCTPTTPGLSNVSVAVHDGNGSHVNSGPLPYRVYPALSVHLVPSFPAIDVGETVNVTANVTGGAGGDALTWSPPASCAAVGAVLTCAPAIPAPLIITLTVSDSAGATVPVGTVVGVNAALGVTVPTASLTADVGGKFSTRVVVSGGTAPFSYAWTGLPSGCSSTGPVANCTMPSSGALTIGTVVRDAAGIQVTAPSVNVQGVPAPSVSLNVNVTSPIIGDTVAFAAAVQGGTGPFSYAWANLPAGCAGANTATIVCAPSDPGNYTVTVSATDRSNVTVHASTTLHVLPNPSSSSSGGPLVGGPIVWLALVAVAAILIGAVAWRASRRYR